MNDDVNENTDDDCRVNNKKTKKTIKKETHQLIITY